MSPRVIRDGATVSASGREVEVTHPDRVLFPDADLTKGDIVGYYADMAEVMLPHLRERPLTLQRFPEGLRGDGFYMKDAPKHFPDWVGRVTVPRRGKGDEIHHAYVAEEAAIVYLANQGTLTFHVSPARIDDLTHPDVLVVDLDPPEGGDLAPVRDAARASRDVLVELGLTPFLQTTGSKGYHLVVPLEPTEDFEAVHDLALGVAHVVAARDPERLTTEFRKDKRRGRVFLDTNRNAFAQTFVAPYSVRPRPGAPVATPIGWDELSRADPQRYDVRSVRRRLRQKDDPWRDLRQHEGSAGGALERLRELREAEGD